jgi:neutral ceramidase
MKNSIFPKTAKCTLVLMLLAMQLLLVPKTIAQSTWKAGTARLNITPKQPLLMAGYANRTHPAEGKLSELWVKVLVLQDASGNKAAMISSDLLGFPKQVSDRIRKQLETALGLTKSQIILNSSHTHSGPILGDALQDIYPLDSARQSAINQYTDNLEKEIVKAVLKAARTMEPVRIYTQQGVSRFQVNRRNNAEANLEQQTELKGPNDYAVPVFKVVDLKEKTKAILFGYACHATVLNSYEWSGDYPGYAQSELETSFPGVTAMFFQGAAGDQNPLPRKKISLAKKYGRELASAVKAVLEDPMEELTPELKTAYNEVSLDLKPLPQAELEKMAQGADSYMQKWASRMLGKLATKQVLPTAYPYPVQAWKIGKQGLVTLGGEVTIGYAIQIKKMLGKETFVMAYSNDVMGYIPTATILKEGGYEGFSSQMVYGQPGIWSDSIESTILNGVEKTAAAVGLITK